jgi:fatty-acyl-CoA synthase
MLIFATTTGDLVDRAGTRTGDALIFPDERLTFGELARATDAFARALLGLGVGRGAKIGFLMPNTIEHAVGLLAAGKAGAIAVPVNGRFKRHELAYVLEHSDMEVLVLARADGGSDHVALVTEILREHRPPLLRHVVDLSEVPHPELMARERFEAAGSAIALPELKRHQAAVRVRDIAFLMYTSGTTARPKGCLLTHEAVVRQGEAVARTRFLLTDRDAFWDPLPLFHCGGIVPMLGCLAVGARFVHAGHFEPGAALRMLESERCSVAYPAFETIWLQVLDHPEFAATDLSAIRTIESIATPERLARLEQRTPWAPQVSSYGSTECATNLTLTLPDDPYEVRMATLGRPVDGMEIRVVDPESDLPRSVDEVGEICFRGYAQFEGYHKDPELTARTIDDEGFVHTGDLGSLDPEGRLRYHGRLKDMLKVGGENVAAIEVEDYLARHEAVQIVQVVAAPDERYGEVPAAFVELKPGVEATEEQIIAFCQGQIASYKVPRYVRFVTDWPMSGTKIQKFALRDRVAEELRG